MNNNPLSLRLSRAISTALWLGLPGAVCAADIEVTTLNDDRAACSLAAAVASANSDAPIDACTPGEGVDRIVFTPSLSGTIELNGQELLIQSSLSIEGPGADSITVSANRLSRVVTIDDGAPATAHEVVISGLTLANGQTDASGGAIYNREALVLSAVTLTGNSAAELGGGLDNYSGTVSITDSLLTGNSASRGGAISNFQGTLTLNGTSITDNTAAYYGGGLASYEAESTIDQTTFSGNRATDFGGAISNFAGAVVLQTSTLSGNSAAAGGGLDGYGTDIQVTQSTLAANSAIEGGAIYGNESQIALTNTIVGQSDAPASCFLNGGALTAAMDSLADDNSCGATSMVNDLGLGPLQDNGGPTATQALVSGSPAIDAGDAGGCAALTTDQTGLPRVVDGNGDGNAECDTGAFEFVDLQAPMATVVSAPNVLGVGGTEYQLVVRYDDVDTGVNVDTIGIDDLIVTGPGTLTATAASVGVDATVTYRLSPPGGSWDTSDAGEYQIHLQPNTVLDQADPTPNAVAATVIGNFQTAFDQLDIAGNAVSVANGDTTPEAVDGTDFGVIAPGATVQRSFTITNNGPGAIALTPPIAVDGAEFAITQPNNPNLAEGASTSFSMSYSPSAAGTHNATVTVRYGDDEQFTFSTSGQAIAPDIDVSGNDQSIANGDATPEPSDGTDFADVIVGVSSERTFSIRNLGQGTINLIGAVNAVGGGFLVSKQPSQTALNAGEVTSFTLTFTPTTSGAASAVVTIGNDDADEGPYAFSVGGNGLAANTAPQLSDATFSVLENLANSAPVGQLVVSDDEGNIPASGAFNLVGGDSPGAFGIDANGMIQLLDINLVTRVENQLTVSVTDAGGLSDTATVTIVLLREELFSNGFENVVPR